MATASIGSFQKVGFVGLGQMGSAMANTLLRQGVQLVVYDIESNKLDTMRQLGARPAECARDVAASPGLQALITMLPDSSHVREAYSASEGILAADSTCRLFIDSSTTSPQTSKDIASALRERYPAGATDGAAADASTSARFMDAPVSGGIMAAGTGTLSFLCGGDVGTFERARPLLEMLGKRIIHTGDVGTGQCAKLCNNIVMAASMAAVSEALTLGSQMGLQPELLSEVFNCSSARCWSSDTYSPVPGVVPGSPSSRNYQGGFTHRLMVKDLKICLETSKDLPGDLPVSRTLLSLYQQAQRELGSDKDFSSIYQMYMAAARSHIADRSLGMDKSM